MTLGKSFILTLIFSITLFAGDAATFINLGFSPDGKFFAFGQYGYQDGSGFPYAEVYIIDVVKNSYINGGVFKVLSDDPYNKNGVNYTSDVHTLLAAVEDASPLLKKYHINVKNQGTTKNVTHRNSQTIGSERNTVRATLIERKEPKNYDPFEGGKTYFHIELLTQKNTFILGNKNRHRKGIFSYHLQSICMSQNKKAVVCIIGKKSLGFEGPDTRYMVETWYKK